MKFKFLKPISLIGIYAVLYACSSSTEKTSTVTKEDTIPAVSTSAEISHDSTVRKAVDSPEAAPTEQKSASTVKKSASRDDDKGVLTKKAERKVEADSSKAPVASKQAAPEQDNGDAKKGEMLISKSDCFACHKVSEKLVGPSYVEVAKKYPANAKNKEYLAEKIIKGGTGVWGDVFMPPHPSISSEDAKAMSEYILSLK